MKINYRLLTSSLCNSNRGLNVVWSSQHLPTLVLFLHFLSLTHSRVLFVVYYFNQAAIKINNLVKYPWNPSTTSTCYIRSYSRRENKRSVGNNLLWHSRLVERCRKLQFFSTVANPSIINLLLMMLKRKKSSSAVGIIFISWDYFQHHSVYSEGWGRIKNVQRIFFSFFYFWSIWGY